MALPDNSCRIEYLYRRKSILLHGQPSLFLYAPVADSTMDTAVLAASMHPGRVLSVRSSCQLRGRGRMPQRRWDSAYGLNLLTTYVIPRIRDDIPLQLMPLLVGTSAAAAVKALGITAEVTVKWPNDLLVNERKICGVLCEMRKEGLFAGVGMNMNQTEFPEGGTRERTSAALETGTIHSIEEMERAVLYAVLANLENRHWKRDLEGMLYGRGRMVRFASGLPGRPQVLAGRIDGIAEDGALLLDIGGETVPQYAGEIMGYADASCLE